MSKLTIHKNLSDLNLKEKLEEVYCYMDHNKQTIEPYYNDEIKLPVNVVKIIQKNLQVKTPIKKIFNMISDVKFLYNAQTHPDIIEIQIELK